MNFKKHYNPMPEKRGYMFHVQITHEVLLTHAQELEKEHGERPCTSDPQR